MAGFSIDAALKSGFRLARREPLTIFVWGLAYALFGLLLQAIAIGPALPQYLRAMGGGDAEAATALAEQAGEANALFTLPLILIVGIALGSVFYGGVVRALLHPQEGGLFHLKVTAREMWLALTSIVLGLAFLAVVALGAFVVGFTGSLGLGGWAGLLILPLLVGLLYLAARLSIAWVQAFDERRLVVLDAWRLTAGHGWRIVLAILALVLLILIVGVVVIIPFAIVGGILVGVSGLAGGAAGTAVVAVVGLLAFLAICSVYGLFLAVAIAPYVEIYRSLKGVGLPGGETAEVFA